jgi:hypothetical protein
VIDVYACEVHFAEHVGALLLALPEEWRGNAIAATEEAKRGYGLLGIQPSGPMVIRDRPVVTASIGDLRAVRKQGRRFAAIMEHGAGQSYGAFSTAGHHGSYAGGPRREADLFLHPGPHPAARDRTRYPEARVEIIGSPYLETLPAHEPQGEPVIAISTHFDLGVLPETRSAFSWIRKDFADLATRYKVLGHGHPRKIDELRSWYRKHDIEVVRDFREVARRADVFVADNTSALFAFASTGRPTVVINPPFYRRGEDFGLRFWDAVGGPDGRGPARIGIRVDQIGGLADAVALALEDRPEDRAARERAIDLVYAYRSGASQRAASVVLDWAASLSPIRQEAVA